MAEQVVVYTSILNGWDNLHAPSAEALRASSARYICFTNVPHLAPVPPWEFRPAYVPYNDPARCSRLPKIMPHLFFDADYSIWHDGNFALSRRPEDIIAQTLGVANIAAHVHPARDCVYAEGQTCINEKIGDPKEIERQLLYYRLKKHPEHFGLWACGMLARRHSPHMAVFNERWWADYREGCARDQISFPYALRAQGDGFRIHTIREPIWGSPLMAFYWHNAWQTKQEVIDHRPSWQAISNKLHRLREVVGDDERVRIAL
jgi:hypothetical protein